MLTQIFFLNIFLSSSHDPDRDTWKYKIWSVKGFDNIYLVFTFIYLLYLVSTFIYFILYIFYLFLLLIIVNT